MDKKRGRDMNVPASSTKKGSLFIGPPFKLSTLLKELSY